ncbi:MAG: TolC family protein [Gammaproteobacteria bacterium]
MSFLRSLTVVKRPRTRWINSAPVTISNYRTYLYDIQRVSRNKPAGDAWALSGRQLAANAGLPELPAPAPAGLPAELLQRRPDLRAALARLQAADQRVAGALAALLPRLTLTGGAGVRSSDLAELIDPASGVWSIAGGLLQPLFTGGRLRQEVKLNQARVSEEIASYRQTRSRPSARWNERRSR